MTTPDRNPHRFDQQRYEIIDRVLLVTRMLPLHGVIEENVS